jgi:hypothetical protein
MKKNILLSFLILNICLGSLWAQDTLKGSRLNLGSKKKTSAVNNSKFVLSPKSYAPKPFESKTPAALNNYYRSLMFPEVIASSTGIHKEPTAVSVQHESGNMTVIEEKSSTQEEFLYNSDQISVSNIYPNPASEKAEIDYNITANIREAKLLIYNVLGTSVGSYTLNRSDRKLYVNTRDMPTGVYFYQLSIEGKKVATKKMLVRHQQ